MEAVYYEAEFMHLFTSAVLVLILMIIATHCEGKDDKQSLNISCQDFSWNDVLVLVSPHLDDELYTALVMQGQSSGYSTSAAASQAMDKSLPDVVTRILESLIEAKCQ